MLSAIAIVVFFYYLWNRAPGPIGDPDQKGGTDLESASATIRNFALIIAAIIAFFLAIWRSKVSERQAETAHRTLLNEQHQKGTEMLGSNVLAVRLGGIYALQRLASDHAPLYHLQIIDQFCAFLRNPSDTKSTVTYRFAPRAEDKMAVIDAIRSRGQEGILLEKAQGYRLNLENTDLRGANLEGANLARAILTRALLAGVTGSDVNLTEANLDLANISSPGYVKTLMGNTGIVTSLPGIRLCGASLFRTNFSHSHLPKAKFCGAKMQDAILHDAVLPGADLSKCDLRDADLSETKLQGAIWREAELNDAILSGANLTGSIGLTQGQIDEARDSLDSEFWPILEDAAGKPLIWDLNRDDE